MLEYLYGDKMELLDIKDLGLYVNINNIPEDWIVYDGEARKSFKKEWLDVDFEEILDFYELDDNFKESFYKELEIVKHDINLNYLVYLWYFIIFLTKDTFNILRWETKFDYFRDNGSFMLPVLALLMGYNLHKQMMETNNYDLEQINYHKENVRLSLISDGYRMGIKGIRFSQMIWGSRFMKGHIIQVGSLQYELKVNFWNGEDVIFIHIPRNTALDTISVNYSLNNAAKLIKKYLKVENLKCMTESWLLSPELKSILNENSNIINFQKKFSIVEIKENVKDFLNFVFNDPLFNGDYDELCANTTLQKEIKKKLLVGEILHIGIGILK